MPRTARFVVSATLVSLLLFSAPAAAQGDVGFRVVPGTEPSERITGVHCQAPGACVVSSQGRYEVGHIYATDGQSITATLVSGDQALSDNFRVLGTVDFVGFAKVGERLIARLDNAGVAWLTAVGDATQPGAWVADVIGLPEGSSGFGGNEQIGFGEQGGRWLFFARNTIYETLDQPGAGALWLPIWSPDNVPADLLTRKREDPTLCLAQPSFGISPQPLQTGYVAPDLSVVLYTAGSRNQGGTADPGVCLSVDGGASFHHVPFPEVEGDLGPIGVGCTSADHCFAYGGLQNSPESVYIYVTNDASAGVASTWTRATLPNLREDSRFRSVAFGEDDLTGWAVGAAGSSSPLVLRTADGGLTWTDATALVRALAPETRLHLVYVADDGAVWIGGENGLLLVGNGP